MNAANTGEDAMNKANLAEKLSQITDYWKPRILCELNGQELKIVKVRGAFVWQFRDGSVGISY
jgi:hypothetical protein